MEPVVAMAMETAVEGSVKVEAMGREAPKASREVGAETEVGRALDRRHTLCTALQRDGADGESMR